MTGAKQATPPPALALESFFSLPEKNDLYLREPCLSGLRFLERQVLAHPADLVAHTRRIFLARSLMQQKALFAALVDLNIATGQKARDLRLRLFNACRVELSKVQRDFLKASLDSGLSAEMPVPDPDESLLTSGARCAFG